MATIDDVKNTYATLLEEHDKFDVKGNGAAGTRARKAAMELTKLMKSLRTEIQDTKNARKDD